MGLALFLLFVEHARTHGSMDGILLSSAILALGIGILALGATQWNDKSGALGFITNALQPLKDFPAIKNFPGAPGGFNANEIAGALAWITPLMAGLALYKWRWPILRITTAVAFWVLLLALFLGQSRFAIGGVVVGLAGIIFLLIPVGRRRTIALAGLALFILLEAGVALRVFNRPAPSTTPVVEGSAGRDEMSVAGRLDIWKSALEIMHDYPLTGVGLNLFRSAPVRARYPAPAYDKQVLPHAHNEFLQVGSDMGIPGLLIFAAWYVTMAYMLIQTWRHGDQSARVVAVATGAGLLAHAVFGMGDAVALWDRFIFLFWWLFGIAGAQYVIVRYKIAAPQPSPITAPQSVTTQPQHSLLS
jgi:O-antigen ligase